MKKKKKEEKKRDGWLFKKKHRMCAGANDDGTPSVYV